MKATSKGVHTLKGPQQLSPRTLFALPFSPVEGKDEGLGGEKVVIENLLGSRLPDVHHKWFHVNELVTEFVSSGSMSLNC